MDEGIRQASPREKKGLVVQGQVRQGGRERGGSLAGVWGLAVVGSKILLASQVDKPAPSHSVRSAMYCSISSTRGVL